MKLHHEFEWDDAKAEINLEKHGVSFEDAQVALSDAYADVFHLEEYDDDHSDAEDRIRTLCSDPFKRSRVLVVVWTQRIHRDDPVTRIISARPATRRERKAYEQFIA